MDDLTICKKIAGIEGVDFVFNSENCKLWINKNGVYAGNEYNPLTDDALCWGLMLKYGVLRELCEDYRFVIPKWNGTPEYFRATDENPNRALCLCIIELHKESNNE